MRRLFVMHFVYVIKSLRNGRYYVGETTDLNKRLKYHNDPMLNTNSTKSSMPWEYLIKIKCKNRRQALKIERHIKKMKSRRYIENLCKYPEMVEKLLIKYNCEDSI